MKVVVIDPVKCKVIHVPQVYDLVTYCATRLGETAHFYPLNRPQENAPCLSVCREYSPDVFRPGQTYFRFKKCPVTFPGVSIFFGQDVSGQLCAVPEWFWIHASKMPIWCDKDTRFLRYTMSNTTEEDCGFGSIPGVQYKPIFITGEKRHGEWQSSLV
jgi:hypothetical protein